MNFIDLKCQVCGYPRLEKKDSYYKCEACGATKVLEESNEQDIEYNDAIKLIEAVYPYLIIPAKKKRAQLILTKYKLVTPRNGRYSEEMLKAKLDFYNEFISIKW